MKKWNFANLSAIKIDESEMPDNPDCVDVKIKRVLLSKLDLETLKDKSNTRTIGTVAIGLVAEEFNSNVEELVKEAFKDEVNTVDNTLHLGRKVIINPYIKLPTGEVKKMGVDEPGLLSDFVQMTEDNLNLQLNTMSDDEAIFVPYIALGLSIFDKFDYEKGDTVVIVASNAVGLIVAQIAKYYQLVPILVSSNKEVIQKAEEYDLFFCHDPNESEIIKEVLQDTSARMADYLVYLHDDDCTFQTSLNVLKHGGTAVVASLTGIPKNSVKEISFLLEKEINVLTANNGYKQFNSAINLVARKIVKLEGLINERIDVENIQEAISKLSAGSNSLIDIQFK